MRDVTLDIRLKPAALKMSYLCEEIEEKSSQDFCCNKNAKMLT